MELLCPRFKLTWFDGAYPSTSGELALLGDDDLVEDGQSLNGMVQQAIQPRVGMRAAAPNFSMRGNRSFSLEWETVRETTPGDPNAALEIALDTVAAMPDAVGWVRVDLVDSLRAWALEPAAVESAGWRHDPRVNLIRFRWRILCGVLTEISGDFSGLDILMLETGYPLLIAPGEFLYLS